MKRLLSEDRSRLLLELRCVGFSEGWDIYEVTFGEMTSEEFHRATFDEDARDVHAIVEWDNGSVCSFAGSGLIYDKKSGRARSKWVGMYATSPRGWRYDLLEKFGVKRPAVPQERAPIYWRTVSRRKVRRLCDSSDPGEVVEGVMEAAGQPYSKHLRWTLPLLKKAATHADGWVRAQVCRGLGEIARLHGVADPDVLGIISRARGDADEYVRRTAEGASKLIERFVVRDALAARAKKPRNNTTEADAARRIANADKQSRLDLRRVVLRGGLGDLRFGMSPGQVRELLGDPDFGGQCATKIGEGLLWVYDEPDLNLAFRPVQGRGECFIHVWTDSPRVTLLGRTVIGSSLPDMRAALVRAGVGVAFTHFSDGITEHWFDRGLLLESHGDRIERIAWTILPDSLEDAETGWSGRDQIG
jgi:hypothetical protein